MAEQVIINNVEYSFFNSVEDDRLYDADDLCNWLKATKTNGVITRPEGQLKVTAGSGLAVNIAAGVGVIDGRRMELAATTSINLEAANTAYDRIDIVGFRIEFDNRRVVPFYRSGTAAPTPVAPTLMNNTNYKEMLLATITVPASATSIGSIKDERTFAISTETTFQERKQIVTTTSSISSLKITTDYVPDVDVVRVLVNGNELNANQFSISEKVISFVNPILSGNTIEIKIWHFVDKTNVENMNDALNNLITKVNNIYQYYYYATGTNDNIALSNIAQNFLAGTGEFVGIDTYASMNVIVCGDITVGNAFSGNGTSTYPYTYFAFGRGINYEETRRITFDFCNVSRISFTTLNTSASAYHNIFSGNDISVMNAKVVVNSNGNVTMFDGVRLNVRECELYGTVTNDFICFKCCGVFENNKVSILSTAKNAFCYYGTGGLARFSGGNYYAWTGGTIKSGSLESVCFYVAGIATVPANSENVVILDKVNCPLVSRASYTQSDTIKINHGYCTIMGSCYWKAPALYSSANCLNIGSHLVSKYVPY